MGEIDGLARTGETQISVTQRKRWLPYDSMVYKSARVSITCDPNHHEPYTVSGSMRSMGSLGIDIDDVRYFVITRGTWIRER